MFVMVISFISFMFNLFTFTYYKNNDVKIVDNTKIVSYGKDRKIIITSNGSVIITNFEDTTIVPIDAEKSLFISGGVYLGLRESKK